MDQEKPVLECDVAIVGGGLAGSALAAMLASKGVDVVCIEPNRDAGGRVGESLDWSSPALLQELGFDRDRLVEERFGTYKRHVRIAPVHGPCFELAPQPWFAWRPWNLERLTLHLDRERFDPESLQRAVESGARFHWERASRILVEGEWIRGIETPGALVRARRYVDAGGRSRLFGRALSVPCDVYGVPKVTLWTYLPQDSHVDGTTLTLDPRGYLSWIWEIPISREVASVGFTLPAAELKRRVREADVECVLADELRRHAAFRDRLTERLEVRACSFQNHVQRRVCGPNWLVVGEAAAMIDPLTSNGFTSALRYASHAAVLIEASLDAPAFPERGRRLYDRCLRSMGSAFNRHIEHAAYRPEIRERLGIYRATLAYVLFGYFANAAYQKLRPRGFLSASLLQLVLGAFELWFRGWTLFARLLPGRTASVGSSAPHDTSRSAAGVALDVPAPSGTDDDGLPEPDPALPYRPDTPADVLPRIAAS